jgi:hypothetical protein
MSPIGSPAGIPGVFGPCAMSDLSPECAPKRPFANASEFMGSRPSSGRPAGREPPGASGALLRFVYERRARRDKIMPAKGKCHVR